MSALRQYIEAQAALLEDENIQWALQMWAANKPPFCYKHDDVLPRRTRAAIALHWAKKLEARGGWWRELERAQAADKQLSEAFHSAPCSCN